MPRAVFYVERKLSSEGSQGAGLGRAAAVMSARVERRTVSRIAGGCAALDGGGRARRRPAGAVAAPFSRAGSGGRTLAGCVARMAASSGRGGCVGGRRGAILSLRCRVCPPAALGLCFGRRRRGALTSARIPTTNAINPAGRPARATGASESGAPQRTGTMDTMDSERSQRCRGHAVNHSALA